MSEFFQIVGLGSVTTLLYVLVTAIIPMLYVKDDLDLVFPIAYIFGMVLFLALVCCWARGVPCPFAL